MYSCDEPFTHMKPARPRAPWRLQFPSFVAPVPACSLPGLADFAPRALRLNPPPFNPLQALSFRHAVSLSDTCLGQPGNPDNLGGFPSPASLAPRGTRRPIAIRLLHCRRASRPFRGPMTHYSEDGPGGPRGALSMGRYVTDLGKRLMVYLRTGPADGDLQACCCFTTSTRTDD